MPRGIAKDHVAKRAALRKGAARYFAQNGFDRASMTGAAHSCGISKALIYHYYDSKEALLVDIQDAHLSELVATVETASGQGMEPLIAAILVAYEDAAPEHRLQLDALHTLPPDQKAPLRDMQKRLVSVMMDEINATRPGLPPDRLRAAAMTVFSILNWFYVWHRPGKGLSRGDYAALAAEFVQGGLDRI